MKPEGNASFFEGGHPPRLLYACQQTWSRESMPRPVHQHEDIAELLVVQRGTGRCTVGNESDGLETGDVVLCSSGQLHEIVPDEGAAMEAICFGMSGLRLPSFAENQFTERGFVRKSMEQAQELFLLCDLIYRKMSYASPPNEEMCHHLLAALVVLALSLPERIDGASRPGDYTLVGSIKKYIDDHYTEAITLGSIAEALSISPYYASHVFKQYIGYSPIQYVIRRRIGQAQNLLIGTDYSATHIGMLVGYENTNYFNTIFTKMVGVSPIRYRKQFLETMQGERKH